MICEVGIKPFNLWVRTEAKPVVSCFAICGEKEKGSQAVLRGSYLQLLCQQCRTVKYLDPVMQYWVLILAQQD